jgi:DNA polymerase-1
MVGADFRSLEDMISALQTKDPNKLKIYTDGYDGHCLRAYKYFGDKMPDIDPSSIDSINSIQEKYPLIRQLSKSPTFLLTYMGTWRGLMKQFGFTKAVAQKIEKDYHDLYAVSDKWVMDRILEAGDTGFVELAFGLKLRTPILPQVVITSDAIPYQAHKEIKTAGNALGQSYGLLNTRAGNEFMEKVWSSKYAEWILPICQIHDSQYFMIRNTLGCLKFVNDNLIGCMEWNKLSPIQHDTIKLGANLEIYFPDWSNPIKVPNYQSLTQLETLLRPGSAGV